MDVIDLAASIYCSEAQKFLIKLLQRLLLDMFRLFGESLTDACVFKLFRIVIMQKIARAITEEKSLLCSEICRKPISMVLIKFRGRGREYTKTAAQDRLVRCLGCQTCRVLIAQKSRAETARLRITFHSFSC